MCARAQRSGLIARPLSLQSGRARALWLILELLGATGRDRVLRRPIRCAWHDPRKDMLVAKVFV